MVCAVYSNSQKFWVAPCMIKTGHILANIPHDEKTTIESLRSPSLQFSGRAELQPVLLISSGGSGYHTHTDRQILHKVHSLITAAEDEKAHNWKHRDQQNTAARKSTDTQNEKV